MPSPIVIEVKASQSEKAALPIEVTLLGIVIEVKEQPQKASSPIEITLLGIVTDVKVLQNAIILNIDNQ